MREWDIADFLKGLQVHFMPSAQAKGADMADKVWGHFQRLFQSVGQVSARSIGIVFGNNDKNIFEERTLCGARPGSADQSAGLEMIFFGEM
jgi:hypothetical protein